MIEEDFHLSFPYIFEHKKNIYMIPESAQNQDIRLYKCTNFPYSWQLEKVLIKDNDELIASVKLTNSGKLKGKEVVQLYIKDKFASSTRPVRELKGFQMIELNPGETKNVSFKINSKMLEFYSSRNIWESENGDFELFIGTNSNTKRKESFELKSLN